MSADILDLEMDGGPENTAKSFSMFACHLVKVTWKGKFRSNRMVRHHTHNIQDQRFYIVRYFGWNKSFITTNLAQALCNMLLGYRRTGKRVVLLLLVQNYDWDTYFRPCCNPNAKQTACPLSWEYSKPDTEDGMPNCRYKQFGDASPDWVGEGGNVDGPPLHLYMREPVQDRPTPLPPHKWVTKKIKDDIDFIIKQGHCGDEEADWLKVIVLTLSFTRIVIDGKEGDGDLPGAPAHVSCTDKRGKLWRADFRVLSKLPDNLWAVPLHRAQARKERNYLKLSEEAQLAQSRIFTSKPTPKHPTKYPGARRLTDEEKLEWSFEAVDQVVSLGAILKEEGQTLEKFSKSRSVLVADLKEYCRRYGLPTAGRKAVLAKNVWDHFINATEINDRGEGGQLDLDSDSQESDHELVDLCEEQAALDSDFECDYADGE